MQTGVSPGAPSPAMSSALLQSRVRPAVWAVLLVALAAYSALYVAERHLRPESQVDEPRYPFIGKGPSLDETVIWIRKWIEGVEVQYTARYRNPDAVFRIADRYKQLRHSGCAVTLVVSDATYQSPDHEVTFNLGDIEKGTRAVKMNYDGVEIWKIPLQATGARPVIRDRSGATNYTFIATADRVTAQRVARAFDHAVALCSKAKTAKNPAPTSADGNIPAETVTR